MKLDSKAGRRRGDSSRAALLLLLLAYWAGTQWGSREPITFEALAQQSKTAGGAKLTDDETRTVQVYRQAAPAVASVITRTVEYDFFEDAVYTGGRRRIGLRDRSARLRADE